MNKTFAVVIAVLVLLILGGLYFYSTGNMDLSGLNATSTPDGSITTSETQTPGAPVAVTNAVAYPADTSAVVSGTVTPNGAFTTYWYEYGTTADLGNKTPNQSIGSGFISIPAPAFISGLTKNTDYYFRLVAVNQFGTSNGLQSTLHTTVGTPAPVGSVPTTKSVAATDITRTTANIHGEVVPNKASTQYWFEYGQTSNLGLATVLQSVGDGTAAVPASFALTNLSPDTTYYFRLNAQNQFGTVNGGILNFKTPGPPVAATPVVTSQVASSVGTTTATLRGTVNPYGAQTTYWFEYSTDTAFGSGSIKTTPQKSAGAGTATITVEAGITSLQSKTTYYYRIVAQNSSGTVRGDQQSFKSK